MSMRFNTPVFRPQDNKGRTLPGAQLFFYENYSTTPKTTYANAALTNPNPHPIIADGAGKFTDIFLGIGDYRVILADRKGQILWDRNDVSVNDLTEDVINDIERQLDEVLNQYRMQYLGEYGVADPVLEKTFTVPNAQYVEFNGFAYWTVPGTTLPYTTDSVTYPDPASDPNLTIAPNVTFAYVDTVTNLGDSQLAGAPIWPLSGQESAQIGDDLTNYGLFRFQGGDFDEITILRALGYDSSVGGVLDGFQLTPPYTATIGGVDYQLVVNEYWDEKLIDVRAFGVVIDDGKYADYVDPSVLTDNTNALFAMRDYMIANNETSHQIEFDKGGVCTYKNGFWLRGVKNYEIEGNGVQFVNTRGGSDVEAFCLIPNPGLFTDFDQSGQADGVDKLGDLINSANSGEFTVTLQNVADASKYAAGTPVLIHGLYMFDGGYPPSLRFFEWHVVSEVDLGTGVVTFERVLEYGYNQQWPDNLNSPSVGAPRIRALSGDGFQVTENGVFKNIELSGIDPTSGVSRERGYIETAGVLNFESFGLVTDTFVPTASENILMDNFKCLQNSEQDKLVTRVTYKNKSQLERIAQGTGVYEWNAFDSDVRFGYLRSRDTHIENCRLHADGSISGPPTGIDVYAYMVGKTKLINNEIILNQGDDYDDGYTLFQNMYRPASYIVTAQSPGEVTVNNSNLVVSQTFRPGMRFVVKNTNKYGRVNYIRAAGNPSESILGITSNVGVVAGDEMLSMAMQELRLDQNRVLRSDGNFTQFSGWDESLEISETNSHAYSSTSNLFLNPGFNLPSFGIITRVEVNIIRPYTGTDTIAQYRLEAINNNSVGFSNQVFDLKTAGLRVLDANGATGSVGADGISAINQVEIINPRFVKRGDNGYNQLEGDANSAMPDEQEMPIITTKVWVTPINYI